jgi:hypothetical protein
MKRQSIIVSLAAISCSVAGTVHAAEVAQAQPNVIFCTEEGSSGFQYREQQRRYERATFKVSRHTVNIIGAFESISVATSGASTTDTMQCRPSRFSNRQHIRECNDRAGYSFTYNTSNNRFTYSQQSGYVYEDGDSITVSFGTCQRF